MRYYKVIEHIESMIRDQQLQSGSKLPSIRILANELTCSKSTVLKAYETMVSRKLAYVIDKTGYYLMQEPKKMLLSDYIDFSSLILKPSLISKNDIQMIFNDMMNHYQNADDDVQGIFDFRNTLKIFFRKRKLFTNVHDICIASSKQEALNLILQSTLDKESEILVENPSDMIGIKYFKRKGRIHSFNRIDERLDFQLIEYYFIKHDIKLIYITPNLHLPMGYSMTLEEKVKLLELCCQYDVYIIENNELDEALPYLDTQSLYALDKHDIVFHIKSFDKLYSSQFKMVAMVTPHVYIENIKTIKDVLYGETSQFEQLIIREYLHSDILEKQLLELQNTLEKRYKAVEKVVNSYEINDSYKVIMHTHQMLCFVQVPSHFNLETMIMTLQKQNIGVRHCYDYFMDEHFYKGIILSLANADTAQLIKGIHIIMKYLEEN